MVASATQIREAKASHQRLRGLVSEMILLSYAPQNDAEVFPQFLQRMAEALEARGGAIWSFASRGEIACVCEYHARDILSNGKAPQRPGKTTLMQYAKSSAGGVVAIPSEPMPRAGMSSENPCEAIIVPIHLNGAPWGAIELLLPAASSGKAQSDALTFARHMARVLSHRISMQRGASNPARVAPERISPQAFKQQPLPPSKKPAAQTAPHSNPNKSLSDERQSQLLLALHESLDLEATAFVIANEFRQLLRCDRVSVLVARNGACRMLAVSGQDTINRRADVVRQLETLAKLTLTEVAPLWLERDSDNVPAHFQQAIDEHREIAPWRHLGLIPLRAPNSSTTESPAVAVLVIEQMHPIPNTELPVLAEKFAPHAARALVNALEQEQIFLLLAWKRLGHARQAISSTPRRKLATIVAGLLLGTGFMAFYPVAFHVQGTGALQPVSQRDVFAEVDGVVTAIHVEHGEVVQQGDVLLELRNTDLDVQIADILGQRRSAQEQLASIQRMRHAEHISREEENRLTGQLLQLQEQLKGLDMQHSLLQKKKARLIVRSPMSGHVSTWNVHRQLMLRPVMAGQILITIADGNGPWNLEVYLPESEAGHLLAAPGGRNQSVEYLVTSQPTVTHAGQVAHIDDTAQLYEEFGHAVRVLVNIDKNDLPSTPAGTTATARIHCGQKSIGYVWLHRMIDFIHTRILFPLF